MTFVTVRLEDERGILEEEISKPRKREESEILFECLQAMLKLLQSILDDFGTVMLEECQSSVRIALVDEQGIQKVESSISRRREESEILFSCLQGTLLTTEAVIDRVTVLAEASVERLEGSQLS